MFFKKGPADFPGGRRIFQGARGFSKGAGGMFFSKNGPADFPGGRRIFQGSLGGAGLP